MPPAHIPQTSHRHGAPSGPWPFLDLDSELAHPRQSDALEQSHESDWSKYPQSLFPNWTSAQQLKSGIKQVVSRVSQEPCTIYHVNVWENGTFTRGEDRVVTGTDANKAEYWGKLQEQMPDEVRLRALFIDQLSGPVLQIYNVEPFFFSSTLNWIPARYQEAVGNGDHITLTLTFIRSMQNPTTMPSSGGIESAHQVIDTQAPLALSSSNRILVPDILAIHMVRSPGHSTIISCHPPHTHTTTSAHVLRTRLLAAGQSVYWKKIFTSTITSDPTFVLLALLWYPLYAFDEALEALYRHICWLEARVTAPTDMTMTQQLHLVRAHLLHYASLLEGFRKTVLFVAQTRNPVLEHVSDIHSEETIAAVTELMRKESENLLSEIARLEKNITMQDKRLKNAMNLGFSSVNLEDSKRMKELTEAALRDTMKQISYLTMLFLPANFAAAVYGMNVKEITPTTNGPTLLHYFALAIPLTAVTVWLIVAFQYRTKAPKSIWWKFSWPLVSIRKMFKAVTSSNLNATHNDMV
ncbi:hypothetical protein C8R44DRAFT_917528 [Mycena epipterygia]|nr:hypothetical protein C8R44DRAFT_917528 [Mycena epipterygia]